jgi:hypothetical protein
MWNIVNISKVNGKLALSQSFRENSVISKVFMYPCIDNQHCQSIYDVQASILPYRTVSINRQDRIHLFSSIPTVYTVYSIYQKYLLFEVSLSIHLSTICLSTLCLPESILPVYRIQISSVHLPTIRLQYASIHGNQNLRYTSILYPCVYFILLSTVSICLQYPSIYSVHLSTVSI